MDHILIRHWYDEHGPALLMFARTVAGEAAAAEDAVHQVFLRLLEGRVPKPDDPRPYLFRAVRNAVLDARRHERGRSDAGYEPWFEPAGPDEDRERLEAALEELPADQREVVVMKTWGELTFEEIAGLLAISANTAASRWRYGLEKLRALLARTEAP
jgi:RNA polymerase sigma-70 factor, ECF subfamily